MYRHGRLYVRPVTGRMRRLFRSAGLHVCSRCGRVCYDRIELFVHLIAEHGLRHTGTAPVPDKGARV